jgi:hypothetical protein
MLWDVFSHISLKMKKILKPHIFPFWCYMQDLTTPNPYENHIPYIIHKECNYKFFFEFQGHDKCYM